MKRLLLIIVLLCVSVGSSMAQGSCPPFVRQAIQSIGDACVSTSRNQACYGNNNITIDPLPNVRLEAFDSLGDLVALTALQSLTLSPLDTATEAWGLSLLLVQASLPETMPGENVVMLLAGDVSLENTDGSMQAFYFRGGIGEPACASAPDGILLQTPPNLGPVELVLNGMSLEIGSTLFINALSSQQLADELTIAETVDAAPGPSDDGAELISLTLLEGSVHLTNGDTDRAISPLSTLVLEATDTEGVYTPIASYALPLATLQERFGDLLEVLPEAVDLELVAQQSANVTSSGDCAQPLSGTWTMELITSDISACPLLGASLVQAFSRSNPEYVEFPTPFRLEDFVVFQEGFDELGGSLTSSQLDACTYQLQVTDDGLLMDVTLTLRDEGNMLYDYNMRMSAEGFTCNATFNLQLTRTGD